MDDQTEVQTEICGCDAGIEDDTPTFQNITPARCVHRVRCKLFHTGSYSKLITMQMQAHCSRLKLF